MKRATFILLLCAACSAKVPDIDPTAFACVDDAPLADGSLPCPDTHWCSTDSCTPRLGCFIPNASRPGCDPERRCEDFNQAEFCKRCDVTVSGYVAAVSCGPGVHTTTSTRPNDAETCECPDGTSCVAFTDAAAGDAYPLYLLPPGTPLPIGKLGIGEDHPDDRLCTRACSSELDCPAAHTCRAAAVVHQVLLDDPRSTRSTVGVCWPERLTSTSTVTPIDQPDPFACYQHKDCSSGSEPCRFRTLIVPDHPRVPAGAAWGQRFAVISRCSSESTGGRSADMGCTEDAECKSGLCASGRCAIPCNPQDLNICPSNRACIDVQIIKVVNGAMVEDRAQICAEL